jgi:hypothetical protein
MAIVSPITLELWMASLLHILGKPLQLGHSKLR